MDLNTSLDKYSVHLETLLKNDETLYRFKCLSGYDSLGCFCDPTSSCHVDIIRNKLQELGLRVPPRQSVKVKYLRKTNIYDNLEQWVNNTKNHLCIRRGRIFIGSRKEGNQYVYHYKQSEWANPYKVV